MSKADLHVHSKYSNRPTNFFLKKLGAAESLTAPEDAYRLAKRRGMEFFTLTDADTLTGCLEIAHHPDVFCSVETTVAFPENECKIKLLVLDLSESQLSGLLNLRGNVYSVRDYVFAEKLLAVVAAPLEILNSRLDADTIEKLLLLFDHFEARCGGRHERTNQFLAQLLERLTPELMHELEKKWKIRPACDKPWQKALIGGSNDYCGQYIGLTWTEVEADSRVQASNSKVDFLAALKSRRCAVGGIHGSTIASAHSMYRVGLSHYQQNLEKREIREPDLLSMILERVLQPGTRRITPRQWLSIGARAVKRMLRFEKRPSAVERRLMREFIVAYRQVPADMKLEGVDRDDLKRFDERLFALADDVIGRVSYRMFMQAAREFNHGRVGHALSYGAALLPLQSALAPYIYSFGKLNLDRPLLARLETRFAPFLDIPQKSSRKKIAWFSDTVTDVNGVSLTLHKMAEVAERLNEDLTIVCSMVPDRAPKATKFLNFVPVGEVAIPDYELQKLVMPPGLRMLHYLEQADFSEYVISTPGPVGIIALIAAKMFNVPCRAIYHSDFPQHVRMITGDEGLEQATWTLMRWFYLRADAIYSPSAFYRDQLVEHGFPPERMRIFHRGTDLEFFNPRHRDERFYEQWGSLATGNGHRVLFVYTGRVSREKNLDVVLSAFMGDADLRENAALAIVGDGPYREELIKRYEHPTILFPGFLKGKLLAKAYASADVFVFPSTTDTYGNSVLEAQASGLPALVSDEGGPKEIISLNVTGRALAGHDVEAWRLAMRELVLNPELRMRMSAAARAHAATRDWTTAFREFWDEDPYQSARRNSEGGGVKKKDTKGETGK